MISKDFFEALKELEETKGIPQDEFILDLQQALTAAFKKYSGMAQNSEVKINPEKATIKTYLL